MVLELIKKTIENNKIINSIGIELEGGSEEDPEYFEIPEEFEDIINDFYVDEDGSVETNADYDGLELKYWFYIENLEKAYEFEKYLWESLGWVQNKTCGNHIHVKLINEALEWSLLDSKFMNFFIRKYKEQYKNDEKYINRLNNKYCRFYNYKEFFSKNIISLDRYTFINFISKTEEQNTIEFRIMPCCKDVNEHYQQICFIINAINEYYEKYKKRIEKELFEYRINMNRFKIFEILANDNIEL